MKPTGRHKDWPWPLSYIPRSWTSFEAAPPRKWLGNAKLEHAIYQGKAYAYPKPIPDRGQWWLGWPLYFALQTKGGWYFRIGIRFDDRDFYFNWPAFTIKRFK